MAESLTPCAFEILPCLNSKGKGLFASRNISTDEIILSEEPIVSCQFAWNTHCKYVACERCLKSLETAQEMFRRLAGNPVFKIPFPELCQVKIEEHVTCPQCLVKYCSEECRKLAWETYHKTLCTCADPGHPLNNLMQVWREIHYPPESCSIMLIAKLITTVIQSGNRPEILQKLSAFCRATKNEELDIAHKLLGKQFSNQLEVLREMVSNILYEDSIKEWYTPDGFRALFALIGTNGQGIGTSSFGIWATACDKLLNPIDTEETSKIIEKLYDDLDKASGLDFLDCEGSGLYELQRTCNHSCVPNAQITFPSNNHRLSLKALRNIEQGEEILISYLDECHIERSRHSRQKLLKENYLFVCQCSKCLSQVEDPDLTSEGEEEGSYNEDHHQHGPGCSHMH